MGILLAHVRFYAYSAPQSSMKTRRRVRKNTLVETTDLGEGLCRRR